MKLTSISFANYKAFQGLQEMQIKPLTILIGKNSSGKSAIAKLMPALELSMSGTIREPIRFNANGVELGGEFLDLVYNQTPSTPIRFGLKFDDGSEFKVDVVQEIGSLSLTIFEWYFKNIKNEEFLLKYNPDGTYTAHDGSKHKIVFEGFVPDPVESESELLNDIWFPDFSTDYIGPFRILPERQFYLSGQLEFSSSGIKGENAYSLLAISKQMKTPLHELVGKWYKDNFDGWELQVNDSNKPYYQINLVKGESVVNIVDVGQGMNQALPLVVRANIQEEGSIIIVEQPELHLHPAAHGELMELFAKSALQASQSFIVETHSENMILRLRKLIVENDFGLKPDDVVIYSVQDAEGGGQEISEIEISSEGVLSDWPEGVFGEGVVEILAMQNALKRKKEVK